MWSGHGSINTSFQHGLDAVSCGFSSWFCYEGSQLPPRLASHRLLFSLQMTLRTIRLCHYRPYCIPAEQASCNRSMLYAVGLYLKYLMIHMKMLTQLTRNHLVGHTPKTLTLNHSAQSLMLAYSFTHPQSFSSITCADALILSRSFT